MRGGEELARRALREARPSPTGWWRADCPFCEARTGKADRKKCWGIRKVTGHWHCFRCGASGRLEGEEFSDAPAPERDVLAEIDPPEGFALLGEGPGATAASLAPARAYLAGRGMTPEMVRAARIGACARGFHYGRVVVPVLADDGHWLGWVARTWVPKPAPGCRKYLYPTGMARGEVFYNGAALRAPSDSPVLVVEGAFDALALWPDAVATLGTPSAAQLQALALSPRPVAWALDGDAWEQGEAYATRLRVEGQRSGSVRLPPCKDPDQVPLAWLREEAARCIAAPVAA